jgi:hypothetical protein
LQNIKTEFISVKKYDAQIKALNAEIAELKKQIKNIPQSTALTEGVTGAPELLEAQIKTSTQSEVVKDVAAVAETTERKNHDENPDIPKESLVQTGETAPSDDNGKANTPPANLAPSAESTLSADGVPPTQDTKNKQHTPTTLTDPGVHDPDVSTLENNILQAIRSSSEFNKMVNKKRDKILKKASDLKDKNPSINDDILRMQVILALHYLINLNSQTLTFYKKCYQNDSKALQKLQSIIKLFIVSNTPTVTHNTFQKAINDDNFETIMTPDVVLPSNYNTKFIDKIIKPNNIGAN